MPVVPVVLRQSGPVMLRIGYQRRLVFAHGHAARARVLFRFVVGDPLGYRPALRIVHAVHELRHDAEPQFLVNFLGGHVR